MRSSSVLPAEDPAYPYAGRMAEGTDRTITKMNTGLKLLVSAAVGLIGYMAAAATESVPGVVLFYLGACAFVIVLIRWLNSTNRKK